MGSILITDVLQLCVFAAVSGSLFPFARARFWLSLDLSWDPPDEHSYGEVKPNF